MEKYVKDVAGDFAIVLRRSRNFVRSLRCVASQSVSARTMIEISRKGDQGSMFFRSGLKKLQAEIPSLALVVPAAHSLTCLVPPSPQSPNASRTKLLHCCCPALSQPSLLLSASATLIVIAWHETRTTFEYPPPLSL